MYAKLAWRNVKRQITNYLIYFITVTLTVALLFALNNVMYCERLLEMAHQLANLRIAMVALSVVISAVIAFVLGYATSFLLKLRKKEFGMYMTLGMKRKDIRKIFVLENMLISMLSLVIGIFLGLFLYQVLIQIITNLMELSITFASYSLRGLIQTIIIVIVLFILSSITSIIYLKRVSILTLLHGDQKVKKEVKHPIFWAIVTIIAAITMIGNFCFLVAILKEAVTGLEMESGPMMISILMIEASVFVFHVGFTRSVVHLLLKNRKFCNRGTNVFVVRQLSSRLGSNSVIIGILSLLLSISVVIANMSFIMKTAEEEAINVGNPYAIQSFYEAAYTNEEQVDEQMKYYENIIGQYSEITKKIPYNFYTTGTYEMTDKLMKTHYETDQFMGVSELNNILEGIGLSPIHLDGVFDLVMNNSNISDSVDLSSLSINLGGKEYFFHELHTNFPDVYFGEFVIIVPDDALAEMQAIWYMAVYDLASENFDSYQLYEELSYLQDNGDYYIDMNHFNIREKDRQDMLATTAVFVVCATYLAVIYIFLALAILALKVLSSIEEDRKRYEVLSRIGVSEKSQKRALFNQTFGFFVLPFIVPMLFTIPVGIISNITLGAGGMGIIIPDMIKNAFFIVILIVFVFTFYYIATLFMAKNNIIRYNRR